MTTDPFTEAARAEADRRHPIRLTAVHTQDDIEKALCNGTFQAAAKWARDHLAAQEPTDAEVEAAAHAIIALVPGETEETASGDDIDDAWDHARAALTAARTARRDEEKRNG